MNGIMLWRRRGGGMLWCMVAGLFVACIFHLAPASAAGSDDGTGNDVAIGTHVVTVANSAGAPTEPPVTVVGNPLPEFSDFNTFSSLGALESMPYVSVQGGRDNAVGPIYSRHNPKPSTKKSNNKNNCLGNTGDPVVIADGSKVLELPLFALPGEMGLRYVLYYHSKRDSSPWAEFNSEVQHLTQRGGTGAVACAASPASG